MRVVAAAKADQQFQEEAFARQFVMDKLAHYAEMLRQHRAGFLVEERVPVAELWASVDRWLDELCGVAEIRWISGRESEWKGK